MNVDTLYPTVTEKIIFSFKYAKYVPNFSGCYVLTNFQGEIIYIGLAKNLNKRFSQHLESDEKTGLTELGKVYYFYYFAIEDELQLNKYERGWLNQFELEEGKLPILNKIHSPN